MDLFLGGYVNRRSTFDTHTHFYISCVHVYNFKSDYDV